MVGSIVLMAFSYGLGNAKVQLDPGLPETDAKILRLEDESGLTIGVSSITDEQWAEFQRQVAEAEWPSAVQIIPAAALGALRNGNGKLH